MHKPSFSRDSGNCSYIRPVQLKLVDYHVLGALTPSLFLVANLTEAGFILPKELLSKLFCSGQVSKNVFPVLFKGIFRRLGHSLALHYLLALNSVLVVQPAKTGC